MNPNSENIKIENEKHEVVSEITTGEDIKVL